MRVTLTGGGRRADVALPASVPVAELLPEVARTLGLLDPARVHHGHRLGTLAGDDLDGELGLGPQGVADGSVLVLAPAAPAALPTRHDDMAEAVAEAVEEVVTPWSPAAARRTALGAGAALLAATLVVLVPWTDALAPVAVAGVALVLGGVAVAADRAFSAPGPAAVAACLTATYAAAAAAMLAPAEVGAVVAAAGAGALLIGLVGVVVLRSVRPVAVTPALVGGAALAAGLAMAAGGAEPVTAALVSLVVVVLAGDLVPRMALGVPGVHAGSRVETPAASADLRTRVRAGQAVSLAAEVAVGLVLVLVAPVAVTAGAAGASLLAAAATVVALRARHRRCVRQGLIAVAATTGAPAVAAVVAAVAHPAWRPGLALATGVAGVGAVVLALRPVRAGARVRRWADVVEALGVVALLPLLVLAAGWFEALRG